jgi:hypothetical protein
MQLNRNILKTIAAAVLLLALQLPAAVQFSHVFEGHVHSVCTDYSVHLHEQKTDCPICDFHLSSFTFSPLAPLTFLTTPIFTEVEEIYFFSAQNNSLQHPDTRGSPLFS